MTAQEHCIICTRPRRPVGPVCNNHFRKVGESVLRRWFSADRAANQNDLAASRLIGVQNQMILNATAYEQIRDRGQRPFWNAQREQWEDPEERAIDILTSWLKRHQFGRDTTNDANVITQIAAELYPPEKR